MTSFPVRHGGIATQQADAAIDTIAFTLGFPIDPAPFHPVLRGQLLTGMFPRYLRLDADDPGQTLSTVAPWWPPAKIVGRYLTPFLARQLGLARTGPPAGAEERGQGARMAVWRLDAGLRPSERLAIFG